MYKSTVAVFREETKDNIINKGMGFTPVESIVRAVELRLPESQLKDLVRIFGPNDIGGLLEHYEGRSIHVSDPLIINKRPINKLH